MRYGLKQGDDLLCGLLATTECSDENADCAVNLQIHPCRRQPRCGIVSEKYRIGMLEHEAEGLFLSFVKAQQRDNRRQLNAVLLWPPDPFESDLWASQSAWSMESDL